MIWYVCLLLSMAATLVSVVYSVMAARKYKTSRILSPFYAIFSGIFLAIFIGMVPVFADLLRGELFLRLKLILFDALQTIQVFTLNVGADVILDNITEAETSVSGIYSAYMTCLFFAAPMLTFGFLISLFQNAAAGLRYCLHFCGDVYVFSEINEKSVMLAKDLRKNHPSAILVFTGVDKDADDIPGEYIASARETGALIFQKSIENINFMNHSRKAEITFLAIGESEDENLILALKLLPAYQERENTGLYVFSSSREGELLLANAPTGCVKVRRVNVIRSLVYRYLYDCGENLFRSACRTGEQEKQINAVVLGMGSYGTELIRALAWYCQMDGYQLSIHGFDRDKLAEEKFAALYPELMRKSEGTGSGDTEDYDIHIHSGVDIHTRTFHETLKNMTEPTAAFICLGDDETNICEAANLRMLCERYGFHTEITTIVYNTDEKNAMQNISNYRGQQYRIHAVGDLQTSYSEKVLMNSELEQLALQRHLKWGSEVEFWQYEYNYRSSMATAIHMKARAVCGIPGANKEESRLTLAERDQLERLEHRRWNAYMRSEGYVYSGSTDKSSRNDLGKMHHNLVEFDTLSEKDKRKDSSVGTL